MNITAQTKKSRGQLVAQSDDACSGERVGTEASSAIVRMAASQALHRAAHRHAMIATAAYRRAQERGFMPGHELEDWLNAELEVEAAERSSMLCPSDAIAPERAPWQG